MALTKERADALSAVLTEDMERTKAWLVLEPKDAVVKINELGHDFTIEELEEYGKALKQAAAQDELSEDQLEDVAGGSALVIAGAMAIAFVAGVGVGGLEKKKVW